jgi:hypothetical protein
MYDERGFMRLEAVDLADAVGMLRAANGNVILGAA